LPLPNRPVTNLILEVLSLSISNKQACCGLRGLIAPVKEPPSLQNNT
jgi:hypothetical protein